jgi:hypothetical protein
LPADIRVAKEREIAALKHELAETEKEKNRSAMIKKYHMVRFFDRRKAERRLKKLEKQLGEVDVDGEQHHNEDVEKRDAKRRKSDELVLRAKVDLNYAVYAPLIWKYCALFPKRKDGEEDALDEAEDDGEEQLNRGDPVMWERVKKAMEEGKQALEALRDSVTERGDVGKTEFTIRPGKKDSPKQKELTGQDRYISIQTSSSIQAHEDGDGDGNDSDGGFFE